MNSAVASACDRSGLAVSQRWRARVDGAKRPAGGFAAVSSFISGTRHNTVLRNAYETMAEQLVWGDPIDFDDAVRLAVALDPGPPLTHRPADAAHDGCAELPCLLALACVGSLSPSGASSGCRRWRWWLIQLGELAGAVARTGRTRHASFIPSPVSRPSSSVAERLSRKEQVVGSIPTSGSPAAGSHYGRCALLRPRRMNRRLSARR